jgi:DNA-binding MarR family transcriptional regulator
MYNQLAGEYNMTHTQGYVLLIIDKDGGTPSTSIGPELGMGPTGLTRLLKKMEDDGMICRKGDVSDKRLVRICLTKKGIEKRKMAREVVKDFNSKLLEVISPKEFDIFKTVISKVQNVTETYKIEMKN